MTHDPLAMKIGDRSVRANLEQALAEKRLSTDALGRYALAQAPASDTAFYNRVEENDALRASCPFLNAFLFHIAYRRVAVPHGCRDCYKVKIDLANVAELMAAHTLAKRLPGTCKCGAAVSNPYSQSVYRCVFYATGLDAARALFLQLRQAVDAEPRLGDKVRIGIKRGCTEYEIFQGPSDRWLFQPGQVQLEAYLRERFMPPGRSTSASMPEQFIRMKWLELAFMLGDDSYLEFTKGKRLHPNCVSYAPVGAKETENPG